MCFFNNLCLLCYDRSFIYLFLFNKNFVIRNLLSFLSPLLISFALFMLLNIYFHLFLDHCHLIISFIFLTGNYNLYLPFYHFSFDFPVVILIFSSLANLFQRIIFLINLIFTNSFCIHFGHFLFNLYVSGGHRHFLLFNC